MNCAAKAISVVQSSWAIGFALAALVSGIVLRYASWRYVFFVGILPALITLWIQNRVPESEMWEEHRRLRLIDEGQKLEPQRAQRTQGAEGNRSFLAIFRAPYGKSTLVLLLLNFFGMFGWWGLFTWLPPYLSLPVEQGGRGFGVMGTTTLLVVLNLFGMFPGYLSFGWCADHLGRRRSFMLYTFMAALLVPLYAMARSPGVVLVLGTVVRVLWDRNVFRFRDHRQRNFPDTAAGASAGLHLQRRADAQFRGSVCDRARGTSERTELGFLFVRGWFPVRVPYGDAASGDEGEGIGVTSCSVCKGQANASRPHKVRVPEAGVYPSVEENSWKVQVKADKSVTGIQNANG